MRYVQKRLIVVLAGLGLMSVRTVAGQETVVHNFSGTDGEHPGVGLLVNAKGDLFGTTPAGGAYGFGTAFEMSPVAGGGYTETVLHDFGSSEGNADSVLIADATGNLYGTTGNTPYGYYAGTVFELSPTASGSWTEKTIYSFGSFVNDGAVPEGGLTFDAEGNLFGTTEFGGANDRGGYSEPGSGTVFKLTPTAGGTWTEKILYNFGATSTDGTYPEAGLVFDPAGHLYGTTSSGGLYGFESGTAFRLTAQGDGLWTEQILHNFGSSNYPGQDGSIPESAPILDAQGNLYGTTVYGGTYSAGTVFELSPSTGGAWTEKVFSLYMNSNSGLYPTAGLTMDAEGNLYGTESSGGPYDYADFNGGDVFKLAPQTGGSWIETILHSFQATATHGDIVGGGVVLGSNGILYGTTSFGGGFDDGTVFEIGAGSLGTPLATTTLLSCPSYLVAGAQIVLAARVIPAIGEAIPTGTVTFTDPSFPTRSVTEALNAGVGTYVGVVPPPGTYSLFARYSGGPGFVASTSATITMTVTAPPPQ